MRRKECCATWGSSYLHGSLQRLLDVHPLPHDGLVQLPLEGQQVHVGLRLRDQLTDLDGGGGVNGTQSRLWFTSKAAVLEQISIIHDKPYLSSSDQRIA